jgi:hypothetical protein
MCWSSGWHDDRSARSEQQQKAIPVIGSPGRRFRSGRLRHNMAAFRQGLNESDVDGQIWGISPGRGSLSTLSAFRRPHRCEPARFWSAATRSY